MTDKEKLDKLVAETKELITDYNIKTEKYRGMNEQSHQYYGGKRDALSEILKSIVSMQEESINNGLDLGCGVIWKEEKPASEDNTLRKASEEYLKILSETPYNNTPITNAQTIVRELITFLDNPSKYNPNHIEEPVSEDDYAKEILSWEDSHEDWDRLVIRKTAKHFTDWQRQKDEHLIWQISDANYEKGIEAGKKQILDKAINWLKSNINCSIWINDFIKNMEG